MMRVLVMGRNGQLARSLAERNEAGCDLNLAFAFRPNCDLAKPGSAASVIAVERPTLVINAAAYTSVDLAEQDPDLARRINADAVGEIASAASAVGAPLVHISTDYVFGGNGTEPMREEDPIAPLGTYGRTKALGEDLVRAFQPDHIILRTAWVYSPFGANFVKTILRLSGKQNEISVVGDQVGSPTSAFDLADALLALVARRLLGSQEGWGETYHAAGGGKASWADVAEAVLSASGAANRIRRIKTADFPTTAKRPAWSVLDCGKLEAAFGICLPDWRNSVEAVTKRVLQERNTPMRQPSSHETNSGTPSSSAVRGA